MGKLLDAVAGELKPKQCRVSDLLDKLDATDKAIAADLRELLPSSVPHASLARALDDLGHHVAETTLRKHRSGGCSCGRSS